jgi:putative transposase
MPNTHAPYPPAFKAEAVRLVHSGDKSIVAIALGRPLGSIGVSDPTLRSWVRQAEIDAGTRDGLTTSERIELTQLRREVRVLKQERDILKKSGSLLRQRERLDPLVVFAFIEAEKANYPVALLCRMLGASRSGYYAWRERPASARTRSNLALTEQIRTIHERSRAGAIWAGYGAPRIHAELCYAVVSCARKRVARLLRLAGLQGCHRRKGPRTTRRSAEMAPAPDLVKRDCAASAPDQLWVADITYLPTWAGFLYLAVVLDACSRRVVGWAMADGCPLGSIRTKLVIEAVEMASWRRRPAGVIHHSDQGSQYTSLAFGRRLRETGMTAAMGSRGDCFDNAMAERFFATLECELLARRSFPTRNAARLALFDSIEGCDNSHRQHSALRHIRRRAVS